LPPLGLQQQFLCYAARDGADFALRLHRGVTYSFGLR
jgi:hypothetical protein